MRNFCFKLILTMAIGIILAGCGGGTENISGDQDKAETSAKEEPKAKALLMDVDNNTIGTVSFLEYGDYMKIEASIDGLKPGHHGFHIHEKGVCEADAVEGPFTTAGGHFNPDGKMHSEHTGDMPSLYVNHDGRAEYSATFDRLTFDHLKMEELAVMVHSNPDNFGNIPDRYQAEGKPGADDESLKAGDAGERTACGVIVSADKETK